MRLLFVLLLICNVSSVHADVIWPAAFITVRWLSIPVIFFGLLIEIGFVKYFTKVGWKKAIVVGGAMNIVSATLGTVLTLLCAGLITFVFIMPIAPILDFMEKILSIDIIGIYFWLLGYICAILINVYIEGYVVQKMLKLPLSKTFHWLGFANAVSIGMCMIAFSLNSRSWMSMAQAIGIPLFVIVTYGAYLACRNFVKREKIS